MIKWRCDKSKKLTFDSMHKFIFASFVTQIFSKRAAIANHIAFYFFCNTIVLLFSVATKNSQICTSTAHTSSTVYLELIYICYVNYCLLFICPSKRATILFSIIFSVNFVGLRSFTQTLKMFLRLEHKPNNEMYTFNGSLNLTEFS